MFLRESFETQKLTQTCSQELVYVNVCPLFSTMPEKPSKLPVLCSGLPWLGKPRIIQNAKAVALPWDPAGLFPNGQKGKQAFKVTSSQPTVDCLGLLPAPALSWEIQFGPKVPKLGKAKK